MDKQSQVKDALAAALIYGGSSMAKAGILAALVASSVWTRSMANGASVATMKTMSEAQKKAWSHYKQTGKIGEALGKFF